MHTAEISYDVDGVEHIGHVAYDDSSTARRPAVLVCHEGPGLTDHAREVADRLAGVGYVAFALDYYGGGKPVPREELSARMIALIGDPLRTRELGTHGLNVLLAQPVADPGRVAAIGYCFGGTMALELARGGADIHAVVGFHSGLQSPRPEDAKQITGKVLVNIGADDPLIPPQQRADFEEEMRAAGVDWRMNLYGGAAHSFTNKQASQFGMPGIAYHEPSDRRSWQAMIDLFDETFGAV